MSTGSCQYQTSSDNLRVHFVSGQTFRTLSVVLVLVCLPACGLHEFGSVSVFAFFLVRNWLLLDLLGDDFTILSSYSRCLRLLLEGRPRGIA